jgi:hypothetical protein
VTPRRPHQLAPSLPLLAACGAGTASLQASAPAAPVPADLAPLRAVHADHVLVAGDSIDLTTATGSVRVTVNGPRTGRGTLFGQRTAGALRHYLATFTITVTRLSGDVSVSPSDFRLLSIADQVDGGAIVTHEATGGTLAAAPVVQAVVGTWTAPFVEGHGELLYTPQGASRPAALWDFRVEA